MRKLNEVKIKVMQRVVIKALRVMGIGAECDIDRNGEVIAIEYLVKNIFDKNSPVIFDVGANVGEYTKWILTKAPRAKVHCFEPGKTTFDILKNNISSENIVLNNFGLSDEATEGTLFYDKAGAGTASLYNRHLEHYGVEMDQSETVILKTLDEYCESNGIRRIDFLKIDIEGNEYKALLGARKALDAGSIQAIQIEFGICDIDSRVFFKDFWQLLNDKYNVYRITKDGLFKIKGYWELLEVFYYSNYLFVRK